MLSGLALGIFFSYPSNTIEGKGIGKVSPAPLQPDWGPPLRGGWGGGGGIRQSHGFQGERRGDQSSPKEYRGGSGRGKSNPFIECRLPMRADAKNIKEPYRWIRLMLPIHHSLYNKTDKFK